MRLTFDRRYDDKWKYLRESYERCSNCMYDSPDKNICCKHHCGEYSMCETCTAECREGKKYCEK